ncbi:MAG TPA: hypothetical protein ENG20_04910, partial [Methanomicrobia archaeon]|nr:hypothetical protein [Methanomicrobia archaeon]
VAETALEKLEGEKPKFFLLFSTIHYEKYGGFQELLNGVWEVLPEGTPLIGGTVAGFMNNYGCFTRGATALTVAYPNMDVAIGVGRNTRKNPRKAARDISLAILKSLDKSKFKNPFMFCILPGGTVPDFFGLGRKKVIKSNIGGKISLELLDQAIKLAQTGPAREEEVFEALGDYLKNWYILGGSSMDNLVQLRCYQFSGKEVHSNDIVGIGLKSDMNYDIITKYGLKRSGLKLRITKKALRGCVIKEIDGKPAKREFLKKIKWPEDYLDERLYTRTFYYPLGYEYKGVLRPQIIGAFIGDYIACGYSIKTDEVEILLATGESLLNAMIEGLNEVLKHNPKIVLGSACATQIETLGKSIYQAHSEYKKHLQNRAYVIGFFAGEESCTPSSPPKQLYDSFNLSCFY